MLLKIDSLKNWIKVIKPLNKLILKERVISNNELKERPNEFDYGRSQVSNKSKLSLKIRL